MFSGAKIVAIDNNKDELEVIVSTLRRLGLPCLSYNYPNEVPPRPSPVTGLRALFLDIHLVGGTSPGGGGSVFSAPLSMIERLITDENGPYALITWSTTDLHGGLMQRISQSAALAARQPFYSCALSKDLAHDDERMRDEVERLLLHNPPFGALLDWERRVSLAGEGVLREVYALSQSHQGATAGEKMDHMLSRLAVAAFGQTHAGQHAFEAVNETLLPILDDALKFQFFSASPSAVWNRAVTKYGTKSALTREAVARLNSAMLLETAPTIKPFRRGAVLEIPGLWLADREFKTRFGGTCAEIFDEGKFPQGTQPKWVLVQIQAACDFAQPKTAPIPFLLGAVVPATVEKNRAMPASIFLTPPFAPATGFSTEAFKIAIFLGIPRAIARSTLDRRKPVVLGRLRDHLVESIAFDHHSHGSRPGYISFK